MDKIRSAYIKTFRKSEEDFSQAIREMGRSVLATEKENKTEHWDVKLDVHFDVKAIKKINRQDIAVNENIHWVEIKNIIGNNGWLYEGKTDYFSFETDQYWIIVSKVKLQSYIKEKCQKREWTERPELYKLYRRSNRKDVITLVKTIDLIFICECMIEKK